MAKSRRQLEREIAEALTTRKRSTKLSSATAKPKRTSHSAEALAHKPSKHHATVRARELSQYPGAEDWDVASDALRAGDASGAAQVVRALHKEPGREHEAGSAVFEETIAEIAPALREEFFQKLGVRTAHRHVEAINEAIYRTKDPDALIAAVSAAKKHRAAIKRLGLNEFKDSSGVYDPANYVLGNLLVKAEEMVRRIKLHRKTGQTKFSRHTVTTTKKAQPKPKQRSTMKPRNGKTLIRATARLSVFRRR